MSYKIIPLPITQIPTLLRWWHGWGETPPPPGGMPLDSTFIALDQEDSPILAASLILTNTKAFCYMEYLISNPEASKEARRDAEGPLQEYMEQFAINLGYNRILGTAYRPTLINRYKELGYVPTQGGIQMMMRELPNGR